MRSSVRVWRFFIINVTDTFTPFIPKNRSGPRLWAARCNSSHGQGDLALVSSNHLTQQLDLCPLFNPLLISLGSYEATDEFPKSFGREGSLLTFGTCSRSSTALLFAANALHCRSFSERHRDNSLQCPMPGESCDVLGFLAYTCEFGLPVLAHLFNAVQVLTGGQMSKISN